MGTITSNFFISLDGVVESPDQWHFPYFNDEMGEVVGRGTERFRAFLMGRVLYDEWAEYWTTEGEGEFSEYINNIPKYVVSNTLTEAKWNDTTLLSGDVASQLRDIKRDNEGDIRMSGSATTVRWLLANGLLDELDLLLHPIVVGHGQRLFEDDATYPLKLVNSTALTTGVLHLTYVPE